jgi:hypothetical protein
LVSSTAPGWVKAQDTIDAAGAGAEQVLPPDTSMQFKYLLILAQSADPTSVLVLVNTCVTAPYPNGAMA